MIIILCMTEEEMIRQIAEPILKQLEKIEKELAYPLIVKESYGSLGKRVYLVKNREELLIKIGRAHV